jgi:hypothetical protein
VKVGLFGDIAEALSVGYKIALNVIAVLRNLAVGGFEKARQHFYGGTFAGAIWAQAPENLAGL